MRRTLGSFGCVQFVRYGLAASTSVCCKRSACSRLTAFGHSGACSIRRELRQGHDLVACRFWGVLTCIVHNCTRTRDCCTAVLPQAEKLVLSEGSKLALVGFESSYNQGVYGLVANLGSLVVRLLFTPIEEAAFTAFSRCGFTPSHTSCL